VFIINDEYGKIDIIFIYRTHASLSNDSALQEMIVEGECNLMSERLSLMKPNFLRKYLIKIIEDIQFVNLSNDNIDTLLKICSEYKNKQHIPCSEYCNLHSIEGALIKFNISYFCS